MDASTTPTQFDTYLHILGSGALMYPWYIEITNNVTASWDDEAGHDGWEVTFMEDGRKVINHRAIMRAIRQCAGKKRPRHVSDACAREARNFLLDRDATDFDSVTADEVIQVAVFGQVVYG